MINKDQVTSLPAPENDENVVAWLNGFAKGRRFLLAFADDGVIWGKSENGTWVTSFDAFGRPLAELRGRTLLEAYSFGDQDQVHLYRNGDQWLAKLVKDVGEWIEESQLLWGNDIPHDQKAQVKGFTYLRDKVQRTMDQALPLEGTKEDLKTRAPRLTVHHFIETDENTGEARIFLSSLGQT